jgi:hypothetical protein
MQYLIADPVIVPQCNELAALAQRTLPWLLLASCMEHPRVMKT